MAAFDNVPATTIEFSTSTITILYNHDNLFHTDKPVNTPPTLCQFYVSRIDYGNVLYYDFWKLMFLARVLISEIALYKRCSI